MRKGQIRAQLEAIIETYGIAERCTFRGRPAELVVSFQGQDWRFNTKTQQSAKAFAYECGRLEVLAYFVASVAGRAAPDGIRARMGFRPQVDLEELTELPV